MLARLIKSVVVDSICFSVFNNKLSAWSVGLEICATESGRSSSVCFAATHSRKGQWVPEVTDSACV